MYLRRNLILSQITKLISVDERQVYGLKKNRMGAATWGSQRPFIFVVTVLTPATT
jgi:hypothetical protein